jgi:hypothetical protein
MASHFLITGAYLFLFLIVIRYSNFFRLEGVPRYWVSGIFVLKVLCGIALWLIYTYHYTYRGTSDAFRYFDDAMTLHATLRSEPSVYFKFLFGIGLDDPSLQVYFDQLRGWSSSYNYGLANDNPTVIRFNMVVALFSFGYYHVHTIFFNFFSLIGLCYLFKAFRLGSTRNERWIFVAVFGLPTVMFWGSGVLKEPILLLGLGHFFWGVMRIERQKFRKPLIAICFGFFLLLVIKPYVLFCMIPGVIFLLGSKFLKWNKLVLFGIVHLIIFVLALFAGGFYSPGDLIYVLSKKRVDFYNVAKESGAGSMVQIPVLEHWWELMTRIPRNLLYTYFRPFVTEANGVFYWLASIENSVIGVLVVIGATRFKKIQTSETTLLLVCLSFVVCLSIVIGSCIPVLGAVVRYKVPALPFLCMLLVFFIAPKRTKSA